MALIRVTLEINTGNDGLDDASRLADLAAAYVYAGSMHRYDVETVHYEHVPVIFPDNDYEMRPETG